MGKKPIKVQEEVKLGATSYKQALFLNTDSFLTVYGGAAMCLDATAEFMSSSGWKKISDYEEGDLVGQVDPETSELTLVYPEEYIKQPYKKFTRMRARGLDLIHTDNHRVLYYSEKKLKNPKHITFEEVKNRHTKSKVKGWTGSILTKFSVKGDGVDLTDDEIRLQVAIQADGCIRSYNRDGTKSVSIRMSKERKAERLTKLLDRLGVSYKHTVKFDAKYTNNTENNFYFRDKLGTKTFDSFWYGLNSRQLDVVVSEIQHWDGDVVQNENCVSTRYCSIIKENADFIQYAMHATGRNTSITVREPNGIKKSSTLYTVQGTHTGNGFRCFANKDGKADIEDFDSTDGFCYCFTVPTGCLLIRQNNKVFVTKNSGKSFVGLLKFLKWCDDPNFVGYVFRLHATDLKKRGGAFWTAVDLFQKFREGTTYTQQPMVITFPSGATVSFLGMDDQSGRDAIQGIEISAAMCDEATHFIEEDIWWIISRLRTNANMSPCIWLTCNPDPNSFILDWIRDYYIHDLGSTVDGEIVEGRPIDELSGKQRFYLRVGNELQWGDTYQELFDKNKHRFGVNPLTGENLCKPRSFTFIGASCFDNPIAMKKNPDYVANLASQPRVTMERLLKGNWFASEESSGYFKRGWVKDNILDPRKPEDMVYLSRVTRRCRAWDIAGTLPSEANPDPDYTAGVLIARTRDGDFFIEDVVQVRKRSGENLDYILSIAKEDRERFGNGVTTILPQDPAEAGKAIRIVRAKEFASRGIPVKFNHVGSKKSKLDKFTPFSSAAETGCIYVIKADWNEKYFKELEQFDGVSRRYHDDMVDASSESYNQLATTKERKPLNLSM